MTNGEIRQNMANKNWVIYAPSRMKRPKDFRRPSSQRDRLPQLDPHCPFCPGNEEMLSSVILQRPGPPPHGWYTRVIPNKFPALTPHERLQRVMHGPYLTMPAHGCHEVVIESPLHNRDIPHMNNEEAEAVIETYHRRYVDLMAQHHNMMGVIFRNHGPMAGTSLIHPHSQIIVTPIVPRYVRAEELEAERYYDDNGRCVFCDMIEFEIREGARTVVEGPFFVSFVPFASEVPFEIWVMPRRHSADFGSISDEEKAAFSAVLRDVLERLHSRLNDPDYNYVVRTAARFRADEPHLHWYLRIRPRLTTQAGFEIGSGMSINPSLPERDAQLLRD
jgi:UDPglucose--hexose-1-phosphate uridylyltransferase